MVAYHSPDRPDNIYACRGRVARCAHPFLRVPKAHLVQRQADDRQPEHGVRVVLRGAPVVHGGLEEVDDPPEAALDYVEDYEREAEFLLDRGGKRGRGKKKKEGGKERSGVVFDG